MIALLLQAGCTEDEIVHRLSLTHLQVRTICQAEDYPLDYYHTTTSLMKEIQHLATEWPRRKLAKRFNITLDVVQAIIYNARCDTKEYPTKTELLRLGDSFSEIVKKSDLSVYHVKRIIGKDHAFDPYAKDIEQAILNHERPTDIAKKYNKSPKTIYRKRDKLITRPARKKYVRVDSKKIKLLYDKGYDQQEIATKLNTTQPTVSRHLRNK